MAKSDTITCGLKCCISWRQAASLSARRGSTRSPARLSSRTSSSASSGLSSISRSRMAAWGMSARRPVGEYPVEADLRHGLHERLELHRLHDVAVDAQTIALDHVTFLVGGRHHDDGDLLRRRVGLEAAQHLDAVDLGHLDVEQHEL